MIISEWWERKSEDEDSLHDQTSQWMEKELLIKTNVKRKKIVCAFSLFPFYSFKQPNYPNYLPSTWQGKKTLHRDTSQEKKSRPTTPSHSFRRPASPPAFFTGSCKKWLDVCKLAKQSARVRFARQKRLRSLVDCDVARRKQGFGALQNSMVDNMATRRCINWG